MNGEIYQISKEQFCRMLEDIPGRQYAIASAGVASEIIVGMFGDKPLCYIGLTPKTLISDSAYVWMIVTDEGFKHRFLLARYGKGFVETVLAKYTCIFGYCFSESSARWLKSLGAKFTSENEFEIRRG
jgi:hypothetical protein